MSDSDNEVQKFEETEGTEVQQVKESNAAMTEDEFQMHQVQQLFAKMKDEVMKTTPANVVYFIVEFLCKHYPNHVHGMSAVFTGDTTIEYEKMVVQEFFKAHKVPQSIVDNFVASGFDCIDTIETVDKNTVDQVEAENEVKWLPGHKVRLYHLFNDIASKVKAFKEEKDTAYKTYMAMTSGPPVYQTQAYSPNVYVTNQQIPQNVYVSAQPAQPTYGSGQFKTQFTSSAYTKTMNPSMGNTFKYGAPAGSVMKF